MSKEKFIIVDWIGNQLDYTHRFKNPSFAVPLEFRSWDDAELFLCDFLKDDTDYEESRGELYIINKGELG